MSDFGLEETTLYCPYCGESITVLIDTSALESGDDDYIEDCQVCCRPIRMQITLAGNGAMAVHGYHENET
ncbi:MAG: CPXCG motif-containing cysteine-rich protein [Pseudomonadales bacterium]